MSQDVIDNILCAMYLALWIGTFVWYHWKHHNLDAGSAIIASYVMYAVFTILTLNEPIMSFDCYIYYPLKLFPFIYLYVMLMIALSPTIVFHMRPATTIEPPTSKILGPIAVLIILCALCIIPHILTNFQDGVVKLVTDTDAGKDAYEEQLDNATDAGSGITNIPSIIFNAFSEVGIFLCYYFLTLKKKHYLLLAGLVMCMAVSLMLPVMNGQRGPVVMSLLTIISGYMLFKRYMAKRLVRIVRIVGIVGMAAAIVPIIAITMSRYANLQKSTVMDSINWYVGQCNIYFNNYGLDNGGIRNGDRTFNLVKRVIDPSTPTNFIERRIKYHNLKSDDNIFTTFVGDFAIDFGPIVAFVIFVAFNAYVVSRTRRYKDKISVHQLLLLFFTQCVCMQGGMTLFSFSDTGNLKMFVIFLLYAYLRYHKTLTHCFPKTITVPTEQ